MTADAPLTLAAAVDALDLTDAEGHANYDPLLWVRIEDLATRLAGIDPGDGFIAGGHRFDRYRRLLVLAALQAWASPAPSLVAKLPKGKEDKTARARCSTCGGYHDPSMFHLDYVGHADVTKALLAIDPEWSWEPMALEPDGVPVFDRTQQRQQPYGLWIRLTVGGMTRLGYGSCDDNKADPEKELIGDAIRNAAMRFGVAVDLWSKAPDADGTRSGAVSRSEPASQGRRTGGGGSGAPAGRQAPPEPRKTAWELRVEELGMDAAEEETRRGLALLWRDAVERAAAAGLDEPELPNGAGLVPTFLEREVSELELLVANLEDHLAASGADDGPGDDVPAEEG